MFRAIATLMIMFSFASIRAEAAECTRAILQGAVDQIDFGGSNGLWDAHTFRLENGKLRYVHVITLCPNGCPKIPMPKNGQPPQ